MFRPEFLNRVDAIVTLKPLTPEPIREIVDLQLAGLAKHLREQEIHLEVTVAVKAKLPVEGFDRIYGARPLRWVIITRIADRLSEELLRGRISRGTPWWPTSVPRAASHSRPSRAGKTPSQKTPDLRGARWLGLDISS
jgi:ATP-dependent Clp protease ATP-binding subunit ClpA